MWELDPADSLLHNQSYAKHGYSYIARNQIQPRCYAGNCQSCQRNIEISKQGPSDSDGKSLFIYMQLQLQCSLLYEDAVYTIALGAIKDVKEWKNLGVCLGVKSSKLDEIETYPDEQQKQALIEAWFECDEFPSLDKLCKALRNPLVSETRAAEGVEILYKILSFDMSVYEDSHDGKTLSILTR